MGGLLLGDFRGIWHSSESYGPFLELLGPPVVTTMRHFGFGVQEDELTCAVLSLGR